MLFLLRGLWTLEFLACVCSQASPAHSAAPLIERSDTICAPLTREQCQAVTALTALQTISQRDVAQNMTILDVIYLSLDMTTAVFQEQGYTHKSIDLISQILFLGFKSIHIDLYWNEQDRYWQLCPFIMGSEGTVLAPPGTSPEPNMQTLNNITCSTTSFKNILDQYFSYISASSSSFVTSVLHFYIRLHSLGTPPASPMALKPLKKQSQQLSWLMNDIFGSSLYTPENLINDRQNGRTYAQSSRIEDPVNGFPLSSDFLQDNFRIFVSVQNFSMRADTTYPLNFLKHDAQFLFMQPDSHHSFSKDVLGNFANSGMIVDPTIVFTNTTEEPTCRDMTPKEFIGNLTAIAASANSKGSPPPPINPSTLAPGGLVGKWYLVADTHNFPFTPSSISSYISCGLIPLVSAPISADNISSLIPLANSAIWSWAPDQPLPASDQPSNSPTVNRCAVLDVYGWRVANCYDVYPTLCSFLPLDPSEPYSPQHDNQTLDQTLLYSWVFGRPSTYYDAESSCPRSAPISSPDGSFQRSLPLQFATPGSALQDTSVRLQLAANGSVPYPIWIDLNSISISDCWVSGGPLAACPYDPDHWNRNKVALLSVAVTITFFLLVVIFFLQITKIPVRHNERRWKRLVSKFTESQYEGVPS